MLMKLTNDYMRMCAIIVWKMNKHLKRALFLSFVEQAFDLIGRSVSRLAIQLVGRSVSSMVGRSIGRSEWVSLSCNHHVTVIN